MKKALLILFLLAFSYNAKAQFFEGVFGTKTVPLDTIAFNGPDTINSRWIWKDLYPHEGIHEVFFAGDTTGGTPAQITVHHRLMIDIVGTSNDTLISEWFSATTIDTTLHQKSNSFYSGSTITGETYDLAGNTEYGASKAVQFQFRCTAADTCKLMGKSFSR